MITCKIGIVSFPVNHKQDYFLNLGEIYDKNVKQDVNSLYEIHTNLQYFCEFLANTKNNKKVVPNNIEEIKIFQMNYNLTPNIFLSKKIKQEKVKFTPPELYDISCMIPLFSEKISRCIYTKNKINNKKLFIILPYVDPIVRGKIIKNCLINIGGDSLGYFLTIGTVKGENIENSCELNKNYLLSCGIPEQNIAMNEYDEFPDCILESLSIAKMIYQPDYIFIGVSKEDIGNILKCVRYLRKERKIDEKIFFICD